ncbi:hypothetical protein [Streptomyces sp. NPDC091268]|uniref:hypothetical protein n=1 Tax=Streptomyces sp. NPDC091268 TaxID=3365979 RepID=UPI0037F84431
MGPEHEEPDAEPHVLALRGAWTEGLSVAFFAGVAEDEAIRRLGVDPRQCPVIEEDADPGEFGTGHPDDFDPNTEDGERFVGVSGVPGGVVLMQPAWYYAYRAGVLAAVSKGGGRAYGIYFNPKGGVFGCLAVDGRVEWEDEVRLPRAWTVREDTFGAYYLAYACAEAGLAMPEPRTVLGPPRRWAELPETGGLLD